MKRLAGKVAVITGASGPLARAIALGYAREGADLFLQEAPGSEGPLLIIASETSSTDEGARVGQRVESGIYDVTRGSEVARLTEDVLAKFGRVDVLVNTPGGRNTHGVIFELSVDDWDQGIDLGVKSYFLTCQYLGKEMARRGSGSIINLTSIVSRLGSGGAVPWSAICGARDAMMRAMAHAMGGYGIRVNSLGHGRQAHTGGQLAEVKERLRRLPLGRVGREEDLVGPAIFLATEEAKFVTGAVWYVDGGYTAAAVTDDEHRPEHVPYIGDTRDQTERMFRSMGVSTIR